MKDNIARLFLLSVSITASLASASNFEVTRDRIIGHRGMGASHSPEPENSIVALTGALRGGASTVELDVQLTKDGEVILAHDKDLARMTNGHGCVASTNYADLTKVRLRNGNGQVTDFHVATFREALKEVALLDSASSQFLVDIHIKVYDGFRGDWGGLVNLCPKTKYEELAIKVLEIVREERLLNRVIITAFDMRVLDFIRNEAPEVKLGLLSDYRTAVALNRAIAHKYDAVGFHFKHTSPAAVEKAHKNGLLFYVWSPAKQADMEKLFATYHVDAVITDDLVNALRACKKSCYNTSEEVYHEQHASNAN